MSSNNSSSNRINVPEAKQAMNNFKMQAANEVGVNLKISSLTNPTNAANAIASMRQEKVNSALVSSYISHIIDAFLIRRSQRYDVKGKSYFNYPNKYYPTARE